MFKPRNELRLFFISLDRVRLLWEVWVFFSDFNLSHERLNKEEFDGLEVVGLQKTSCANIVIHGDWFSRASELVPPGFLGPTKSARTRMLSAYLSPDGASRTEKKRNSMPPEPPSLIGHTTNPKPSRPNNRRRRQPNFTEETCRQSASRFQFLYDWYKAENTAYQFALRNGHLEGIRRDYFPVRKGDAWTLEECINDARSFKNVKSWRDHSGKGHRIAAMNGWSGIVKTEVWGHRRWTEQKVRASAGRYSNLHDWIKTEQAAYMQARRKGWLDSIKYDLFANLALRQCMPGVFSAVVVAEVDQATS